MPEPLLEVEGLRKVFGDAHVAVDDVTFSVAEGESLAIVGESGSGKTTVARILVGLETATAGRIIVRGEDWTRPAASAAERRRRGRELQIVFQDPYGSLDPRQSFDACVDEILRLHFPHGRDERARRIEALAELVSLDRRQRAALPRELSGGQRQRVALARALAAEPAAIILDESVAALDVSIQAQILNLLADVRAETNVAYVFISHDLAVVRQISDRTIVMRRGQVLEEGETGRVLDAPQSDYARLLLASVPHPDWVPRRRTAQA